VKIRVYFHDLCGAFIYIENVFVFVGEDEYPYNSGGAKGGWQGPWTP